MTPQVSVAGPQKLQRLPPRLRVLALQLRHEFLPAGRQGERERKHLEGALEQPSDQPHRTIENLGRAGAQRLSVLAGQFHCSARRSHDVSATALDEKSDRVRVLLFQPRFRKTGVVATEAIVIREQRRGMAGIAEHNTTKLSPFRVHA